MPHKFYKHKTLLDEQISPRQYFSGLNECFDTKHIKHDLNMASLPDPEVYELARSQNRIILTKNVKDFHALLRKDSPGIIGIPEAWSNDRIDTKLTALLMKHGPNYFKGRLYSLGVGEILKEAA
jgi:predicted nuclease of predicted toxin-antitoxin system